MASFMRTASAPLAPYEKINNKITFFYILVVLVGIFLSVHQVVCGDRLSTFAARNDNLSQSITHVCQACCQRQDGHDFAGNRDVKLAL